MGNNLVIQILTDYWHNIKADPKGFVDDINSRMNHGSVHRFGNGVEVMPAHHSSTDVLYLSGGNTIIEIGFEEATKLVNNGELTQADDIIKKMKMRTKHFERCVNDALEKKDPLLYKARKAIKSKRRVNKIEVKQ